MRQLGALLWKNFCFCKRHPIKTALFYIIPLIFILLLAAAAFLIKFDNKPDCSYDTYFLPPSHPALILSSIVCNLAAGDDKCTNLRTDYSGPELVFKSLGLGMVQENASFLCPSIPVQNAMNALRVINISTCNPRKADTAYDSLSFVDLMFRGRILYFPKGTQQDSIMWKAFENLDQISGLKVAQKVGMEETMAGNDSLGQSLMELSAAAGCYQNLADRTRGFDNENEAIEHARGLNMETEAVWGIIEFKEIADHTKYRLITHNDMRDTLTTLYLQSLIEISIVEQSSGIQIGDQIAQKPLPRRCMKNPAAYVPSFSSALFVIGLGYIMVCYVLSSEMCHEKSVGLQEFLFIAGVPKWKIKLSWFIFGAVFFVTIAFMIALFFKYMQPKLLANTSFMLILLIWVLYALALLCMCFLCSSLMSTAQRAGMLIFTSMLSAYFLPQWSRLLPNVGYKGGTLMFVKIISFFHSTVAAEIAFAYVFAWEKINKPAEFMKSPDEDDEFGGIMECILYLIIQCPMYLLLSWYFDHVAPSKYGIKWPAWFCVMPSYWGCGDSAEDRKNSKSNNKPAKADVETLDPSLGKKVGININQLTKSYGKDKLAVDQLSVQFYKNEITALLGHNGAGKSTTMNMLTGMISPTEGKATVDNRDIGLEMKEVRQNLGFCPQYDIIYPELSVKEHMHFYGQLKGIPVDEVELFYMDIFRQMKMLEALKTPAASLSGGMKRKLSIAISLMGSPTTVILDEPTSAIDPFSRRAIWDVILKYRSKATVVISTHYMQEADVLGDRIAILDKGSLKCFGTPMYLKANYGSGLKLSLAHQTAIDYNSLKQELQEQIPMELKGSSQSETTFEIPLEPARTEKMTDMLLYLEENMERHKIVSFGVAESTLEQVFFKVAEGGGTEEPNADGTFKSQKDSSKEYENVSGGGIYGLQLLGTWIKRLHLSRKSIIGFVFQILAPLVFVVILLLMTKTIASSGLSGDVKEMHPWTPSFDKRVFYSGPDNTKFSSALLDPGMGTRCMSPGGIEGYECASNSPAMPGISTDSNGKECSCDRCPSDATGEKSLSVELRSKDLLHNLKDRNITSYLIKTSDTGYIGGIEIGMLESSDVLTTDFYQTSGQNTSTDWAELDTIFSGSTSLNLHTVWSGIEFPEDRGPTKYEREMRSMQSAFFNAYSNVLLRSLMNTNIERYGITMYTEEISLNSDISFADAVSGIIIGFFCSLALMMPIFTVLLIIVTENASGNKRIQYLMGLSKVVYWFANFFWDMLLFIVSLGLMIIFMAIFKNDFDIDLGLVFTTGLMYGVAMILFAYVLSFVFKTARTAILLIGLTAPFFAIAAVVLLSFSKEAWYDGLSFILNFFPPYFIADSLTLVSINDKVPEQSREPIFSWNLLAKRYVVCGMWSILMLTGLICLEAGLFRACRRGCCEPPPPSEVGVSQREPDPDVEKEKQRILQKAAGQERRKSKGSFKRRQSVGGQDTMTVEALTKVYGNNKIAVKGVSFGVHKGECFGLLGVNGAGKTTLFKMLTGFHPPTRGDAKILGHSIFGSPGKVAKHMSYCPQEDVIFESLTPGEHLNLYARIRGIPGDHRTKVVDNLITSVGLTPHVKKKSAALSGGNKRKLNFAIAALDYPDVIFLDEMTTGMDPKARRAAWTCLETAIKRGSAAVITSHSMEECEALCNRIVIMVNGSFKCIGGVQYLKDKYGNNYNVKFRLGHGSDDSKLETSLLDAYPKGKVIEKHPGYLEFEIPADGLKLSELYQFIHSKKKEFEIEDFSASQTTLEHVFVNMVREQE